MYREIPRQSHFPASDESEVAGHSNRELFSVGLPTSTTPYWPNSPVNKESYLYWMIVKSTFSFQDSGKTLLAQFSKGPEMTKERGRNLKKCITQFTKALTHIKRSWISFLFFVFSMESTIGDKIQIMSLTLES